MRNFKTTMLIECRGVYKDRYYVPPFTLDKGEVVILFLFGGAHFYDLSMFLVDIFTGQTKIESVTVNQPLKFVEHFKEPTFRRLFFPVTIGQYLKKNSGRDKETAEKVFNLGYLDKKTHVNSLNGDRRKILSLYTTLSNSRNIVFDLVGIDPLGAQRTYNIVKEYAKNGGSAILLNNFPDFKDDCTKYIKLEVINK